MKVLLALLFLLPTVTYARQQGYPVFQTLRMHTYDVNYGTAFNFYWRHKRYLVSNWHVCRNFHHTSAKNQLTGKTYYSNVIASFPTEDLCLLTPVGKGGIEVSQEAVQAGYPVYTGGYPAHHDKKLVLRAGKTTRMSNAKLDYGRGPCPSGFEKGSGTCERKFVVQDTTLIGEKGCSGSPVVNSKAQLVGIVNQENNGTVSYLLVSRLVRILKLLEPISH